MRMTGTLHGPDVAELVGFLTVDAAEDRRVGRRADEVRHRVLVVLLVADARRVGAVNLVEIVDPRRHVQPVLRLHLVVLDDVDGTLGGDGCNLLQLRLREELGRNVRKRHDALDAPRPRRRVEHTGRARDVAQAEQLRHLRDRLPAPLHILALSDVVDDQPVRDRLDPGLPLHLRCLPGLPLHDLDEVDGRRRRLRRRRTVERVDLRAAAQRELEDARVVAVDALPVVRVVRHVVEPHRHHRVLLVAGQRVVELGVGGDLLQVVPAARDGAAKVLLAAQDLVAHPLQLQPREVPDGRDVRLRQVLVDGLVAGHLEAVVHHALLVLLRHRQVRGRNQVHLHLVEHAEAVCLAVDRAAVVQVADEGQVDAGAVPVQLLEERELVEELLRRVLVASVARVQEGRPRQLELRAVFADHLVEPRARALELRAHDEDGLVRAVAAQHLHRVRHALLLVEGGGGGVEDVHLAAVEKGGVPEALLRARGVLHEDQVHRLVRVRDLELAEVASITHRILQTLRLEVEVVLLVGREVVHDRQAAALEVRRCRRCVTHRLVVGRGAMKYRYCS
eukprot:Rhum_TRINITY_DN14861_c18_g1::Rhum_TRINITY_DN14861_c18_g1_i1::g.124369::m.124369